jgi:drug/metabolite transporter (DMT)-like permease
VLPYFVLGGAQLAVGAAAIFARYALGGAGPLAVSAARLCIASLLLLAFAAMRGGQRVAVSHAANQRLIAAGVLLALHFAGWIWSLEYTAVAISTLLVTTTPIWTAMYDALVHRRTLSRLGLAAFVTGAIGVVMVVGFDRTPPPQPGHEILGAALAIISSIAIGAYFILVRDVRDELGTRAIVTRTYTVAAIALVIAALVAHQPPPPLNAGAAWSGIVAMALASQLLGHTAMNASLRWFSPSAIAFATLLEPVIAAVLALLIFAEALPPVAVLGGVILLASIAVVLREERLPAADNEL